MSALICDRCGKEIVPGTKVKIIGPDDPEEQRIILEEDALVVHMVCPQEDETDG